MTPPPRHFSMLREFHLADLFTLLNGFTGAGALLSFMRFVVDGRISYFWLGTALLPVAASVDPGTAKVTHFEGLPIPTSLALVAMVAIFAALGRWQASLPLGALVLGPFTLHPPAVLYFLHGSGMVSKTLRIPKP